jgi:hypothetical protein
MSDDNNNANNGWPEYKRSVLQQLEFLTKEVAEVKEAVHQMDKSLVLLPTKLSLDTLQTRIESLQLWKAQMEGKASRSNIVSIVAVVISAIGILLGIISKGRV